MKACDAYFLLPAFPDTLGALLVGKFSKTSTAQVKIELEKRGFLSAMRVRQYPTYILGKAYWATDSYFDINTHVIPIQKTISTLSELSAFAESVCSQPFLPYKPHWYAYVIENYQGGSAIVLRFHHAYQDGAVINTLVNCSDPQCSRDFYGLTKPESRWKWLVTPAAWMFVPYELITRLRLRPDKNPLTGRTHIGEKTVAMTGSLPLAPHLKRAKALGVTFNDYAIAACLRALQTYVFQQHGSKQDTFTLAIPVNLRDAHSENTGNNIALLMHPMPSPASPTLEKDIHESMKQEKTSAIHLQASNLTLQVSTLLPRSIARLFIQRMANTVTLAFSNLPGPKAAPSYSGVQLEQLYATPISGIAVGVVMVSCAGHFTVTWNADKAVIKDISVLSHLFEAELAKSLGS